MRIGFIGLGVMGLPMARHVAASGRHAVGYVSRHPDRERPLADAGATAYASPAQLAASSDLVVFVVPTAGDVAGLLEGPDGVLAGASGPLTLVLCSTTSPDDIRSLGKRVADAPSPVTLVDAPVSGGAEGAEAGTLSIMVGGADADVAPVLDALAPCGRAVHLGPLGSGQVAKACNQLIVAATVTALAEASVLAERSGLDVAALFDLLGGGYAGSRLMEVKAHRFATHDHSPSGPAKFMIKDLRAVAEEAERTGLDLALATLLARVFTETTEAGWGDLDTAVVQRWVESRARA